MMLKSPVSDLAVLAGAAIPINLTSLRL